MYAIGLFRPDGHPANVHVLPGNRIAYVDFGIKRRLPADVRESLIMLARRLLKEDVDGAVAALTRWVKPSSRTVQSEAIDELKARASGFCAS